MSGDNRLLRSAAIENPSSDTPEICSDAVDCEEGEEDTFPSHLFSWYAIRFAHDVGFEDVTRPPPIVQAFPFVTSLP